MVASAGWSKRLVLAAAAVLVALGVHAASAPSKSAQTPTPKTLTVTVVNRDVDDGTPWGTVTSDPAGIDCPTTCSADFATGTTVTLQSNPAPGYSLYQWSPSTGGAGCDTGPTCTFTIDENDALPSVQAEFQPAAGLVATTAGAGTLSIDPPQPGKFALCVVDAQQVDDSVSTCDHRYVPGTRVTLTANPNAGARFVGWSDYACPRTSRSCTVTLAPGERYVTARFSPVKLTVQSGAFGAVVVTPGGTCTFAEDAPPCEFSYPSGTLVTIRREHGAPGNFWIGACDGNHGGTLDADVCRLRLQGNELVAAGKDNVTAIPPPRGSGIELARAGKGKGKVTGRVISDGRLLSCGTLCSISGLSRYDEVRLAAKPSKGSRFVKWSDNSTIASRTVQLSGTTRIRATFAKRSRRR
jgi:Divergent InlB B-repeat domain